MSLLTSSVGKTKKKMKIPIRQEPKFLLDVGSLSLIIGSTAEFSRSATHQERGIVALFVGQICKKDSLKMFHCAQPFKKVCFGHDEEFVRNPTK